MAVSIEVVGKREFELTENKFGVAKYPTCSSLLCGGEAHTVVTMRKFGHTFHEPMCDECADRYNEDGVVIKSKPTSYQMGLASFFNMPVAEFLDLPDDDRSILQKFVDAFRKDDMDTLTAIVKANKALIKRYYHPEEE